MSQASPKLCARSLSNVRVHGVNIKRNMKWSRHMIFSLWWVQVLNCHVDNLADAPHINMIRSEAFYIVLLQRYPLILINFSDAYENNILWRETIKQPFETFKMLIVDADKVWKRHAVIPLVLAHRAVDEIGMSIHPNHLQVLVLMQQAVDCSGRYWVISSSC